jgi:hypothetical protein
MIKKYFTRQSRYAWRQRASAGLNRRRRIKKPEGILKMANGAII